MKGAVPRAAFALCARPKPRFAPEYFTSTRAKAPPGCSAGIATSFTATSAPGLLSWMKAFRASGSAVGSERLSRSCVRSGKSGWYVTMLMSTSRIEDLLQEKLAHESRQQVEGVLVDPQLHELLPEGAARLDLARDFGLHGGHVGLQLLDPAARLVLEVARLAPLEFQGRLQRRLHLRHLVGEAHQLLAEERAVEVLRDEVAHVGGLRVDLRGRDAEAFVEGVEGA